MPDHKPMDLKQAAIDVAAKIAGRGIDAAGIALDVPAPLVAMADQIGERETAALIEWLLLQGETALRQRLWPAKIEVEATAVQWTDNRPGRPRTTKL